MFFFKEVSHVNNEDDMQIIFSSDNENQNCDVEDDVFVQTKAENESVNVQKVVSQKSKRRSRSNRSSSSLSKETENKKSRRSSNYHLLSEELDWSEDRAKKIIEALSKPEQSNINSASDYTSNKAEVQLF